jgi:hypothetical protein
LAGGARVWIPGSSTGNLLVRTLNLPDILVSPVTGVVLRRACGQVAAEQSALWPNERMLFRRLSVLRRGNLPDLVAAGAFRVIHCGIGDGDQIVDRLAAED